MTAGFLDPGPQIAAAELTPQEQALAARIDAAPNSNIKEIALALGSAFLLYRLYMKRRLLQEMKDQDPSNLELVAGSIYTAFIPQMVRLFAPHLVQGYLIGVKEAKYGDISHEYLLDIAEAYTIDLGGHLNEVSLDAAVQGYTRQVNRRVPARKAVQNVISAYGVPNRTMNSLIGVWTSEDTKVLSSMPAKSARDARAAQIIDKALAQRGAQIGDTESWAARGQAKQLVWMYSLQKGLIPEGSTKIWRTAKDERVCPVCGPLHKSEVPLDEPFSTDAGKIWSPPLHPRCRCDVDLAFDVLGEFKPVREEELVGKAFRDDPYDRDRRGRFARTETRTKPIKLTPITLPDVALAEPDQKIDLSQKVNLGGKINLQRVNLGEKVDLASPAKVEAPANQAQLSRVRVPKASIDLRKVELPTEAAIKAKLNIKDTGRVHENWIRTQEPLYTVISDANAHGEMVFIDDTQHFGRYADVQSMLKNHWNTFIEGEIADHQTGDMADQFYQYRDPLDGTLWAIDETALQEAYEWYLQGEEMQGKKIVLVNETRNGEFLRSIDAGALVEYMGLDHIIEENRPTVMVTDYVNADYADIHETKYSSSARNPGNFRVVMAADHSEWDIDTPLPYRLAHFEPDDLYG